MARSMISAVNRSPPAPLRARPADVNARLLAVRKHLLRDRYLLLLFLPPLLFYLTFHYGPMFGVIIAFKKFNAVKGILGSEWVGMHYFERLVSDPFFWRAVRNTVLLNIYSLIWSFPAPIILALALNEVRNGRFKRVTQTVIYLPHFISTVVVCGIIVNVLASDGIVNAVLSAFGGETIPFMVEPRWFRPMYISSGMWQNAGWGSIIFMAALAGINPELYEAAIVDGASRWEQMRHVSIPGIRPAVLIVLILGMGDIMEVGFEKAFLLQSGSTYDTSDVISTYVYRVGLVGADFSYATAVNLFQSAIGLLFVWTANYLSRRLSETSLW